MPSWVKNIPFFLMHAACLLVFLPQVEATPTAITLCIGFYLVRMFGITAGYHRYFSHRAYKTSRPFQFVMAWLGCTAMQKGPLWWASHHRHHHLHSDQEEDVHSPHVDSLWWSHIGWVLSKDYVHTDWKAIHDFARYPELRWLDRNHWVPGLTLALICYLVGGLSGLVWGFFVSTVITYHATFCINSFCHILGRVRYKTTDKSKNSLFLALVTLGEGWHNNHHHYQSSANQGFFWWEIDISYSILKVFSWMGLVWDLRSVPAAKMVPAASVPVIPQTPAVEPHSVRPMFTPVVSTAKQALSTAAHSASQALLSAKNAASQAAQSAGQVISHAAGAASHAAASAKQVASHAAHSAGQVVSHAAEVASHAAASAKQVASNAAHSAGQALSHAAEAAAHAATSVTATATTAAIVAAPVVTVAAEAVSRGSGS